MDDMYATPNQPDTAHEWNNSLVHKKSMTLLEHLEKRYHYSDTLDNSVGLRVDYNAMEWTWQWRQCNHGMLDHRAGLVKNRNAMQ